MTENTPCTRGRQHSGWRPLPFAQNLQFLRIFGAVSHTGISHVHSNHHRTHNQPEPVPSIYNPAHQHARYPDHPQRRPEAPHHDGGRQARLHVPKRLRRFLADRPPAVTASDRRRTRGVEAPGTVDWDAVCADGRKTPPQGDARRFGEPHPDGRNDRSRSSRVVRQPEDRCGSAIGRAILRLRSASAATAEQRVAAAGQTGEGHDVGRWLGDGGDIHKQ